MDQTRQNPGDYMSSDPAQQRVGDTQAGQDSIGSYENGGADDGMMSGRKGGSTRAGGGDDMRSSSDVALGSRDDSESGNGQDAIDRNADRTA